jgi:hypothetical protein
MFHPQIEQGSPVVWTHNPYSYSLTGGQTQSATKMRVIRSGVWKKPVKQLDDGLIWDGLPSVLPALPYLWMKDKGIKGSKVCQQPAILGQM